MNRKWSTVTIIILLMVFISYIVVDVALKEEKITAPASPAALTGIDDRWFVSMVFDPGKGQLSSVAITGKGDILLGGESFITCYDPDFKLLWEYKTGMPVTALSASGQNIYAAANGIILLLNIAGEKKEEWGPFESNAVITSLSSDEKNVAFADAVNKSVFILDKQGQVKSLIGKSTDPFTIPSLYFDVVLGGNNTVYVANTGNKRIEKRNFDGKILDSFGTSGSEPDAFCGCCNPAHFTPMERGFVTAEKGINRIKVISDKGGFIEFVSSVNSFVPPLPLDIASVDGKVIYGANPADSKLYVFKKKD
ncbi:MAG: hypothetical protein MUF36_04165 [Bacteroidales bacterium]|jgi:outer membrane protein assembly factor BamB|nr:hypothetical protein [Bacteroidales bacterium]